MIILRKKGGDETYKTLMLQYYLLRLSFGKSYFKVLKLKQKRHSEYFDSEWLIIIIILFYFLIKMASISCAFTSALNSGISLVKIVLYASSCLFINPIISSFTPMAC